MDDSLTSRRSSQPQSEEPDPGRHHRGRHRLRSALAALLGTEAVIAMKDSAGLDDDDEIITTLEWAANALLRTALNEVEEPR